MILTDIINILQSNAELQLLLNGNTDKKIYAFNTTKLNSVVYIYTDLISNKIIGQSRLELTINTLKSDYSLNIQILDKVKNLLLTLADEKLLNNIIEISLNGGGILTNDETNTIHNKAIFTIKYREEVI